MYKRQGIIDIFSFGNEWPYRVELFDDEVESIRLFNPTSQLSLKNILMVSIIPNISNRFSQEQKVSLFKIFKDSCCVWIKDIEMLLDKLQVCQEKAKEFAKQIVTEDDSSLKKLLDERAFIFPDEVISEIDNLDILLLKSGEKSIKVDKEIKYNSSPQPHFNKNFKLLLEDLEANQKKKYDTYIFTDNNRQIELSLIHI